MDPRSHGCAEPQDLSTVGPPRGGRRRAGDIAGLVSRCAALQGRGGNAAGVFPRAASALLEVPLFEHRAAHRIGEALGTTVLQHLLEPGGCLRPTFGYHKCRTGGVQDGHRPRTPRPRLDEFGPFAARQCCARLRAAACRGFPLAERSHGTDDHGRAWHRHSPHDGFLARACRTHEEGQEARAGHHVLRVPQAGRGLHLQGRACRLPLLGRPLRAPRRLQPGERPGESVRAGQDLRAARQCVEVAAAAPHNGLHLW
mmetsp:Transcript_82746/g.208250  ORF Transcript_82746/g.208250 Transcript_82746/m.208250 type:complete len:256 (+) Transcript_82746:3116-3883(+)